jgi:tetratricopeptide (TPR) repeat protein
LKNDWTQGIGLLVLAVALGSAPAPAGAVPPGSAGKVLRDAQRAITELRLEDARGKLRALTREHGSDPDVRYLQAQLRFHEGDYAGALRAVDASLSVRPGSGDQDARLAFRELVSDTRGATAHFERAESADGRYVVLYAPGKDEVLAPYALEALEAADHVLTREIGVRVPGPIRLEVYPTPASLAEVSTLTVEAIHRTGTIALCKWDRLMITSPRALVRGYPWMDTIAHELVHLVLTRASHDHAPVWLQEGIAKFLEQRWRSDAVRAALDPAAEALLQKALREGELLPFERLHPSIALLPSQQDAALAFAQVATFVETFYRTHGRETLKTAIERIAEGTDARKALARVSGVPFAQLEARWKADLTRRSAPEDPPNLLGMRFRRTESGEDPDLEDVSGDRARRFLRLGDLLWDRGHAGAAKVEYGKAHRSAPDDPIVASRLGRAAIRAGDAEEALRAIVPVVERHPDYAPARAALASAHLLEGNLPAAVEASIAAIRLNPFDPEPHCVLSAATSDRRVERRGASTCRRLGGELRSRP